MSVFGITGLKGSGKSLVASRLVERYGMKSVKFAGPLKDMLRALGFNDDMLEGHLKEQPVDWLGGRTPRHAMQTLGTEWGRLLIDSEMWVNAWRKRVDALGRQVAVTDDVRFANEVAAIRGAGGLLFRVVRPGLDVPEDPHPSEAFISQMDVNAEIVNDGTIDELFAKVDRLVFMSCSPLAEAS